MNAPTMIALAVVAGVVAAVAFVMYRNKKQGKNACGCDCGSCSGCCHEHKATK